MSTISFQIKDRNKKLDIIINNEMGNSKLRKSKINKMKNSLEKQHEILVNLKMVN